MRRHGSAILAILLGISCSIFSVQAQMIKNIKQFLEQCPTNDPAYSQIRNDFQIRKNGITIGVISCSEPISEIPISGYSDELIVLQTLRVIYLYGSRTEWASFMDKRDTL
jgi:hypothetical protein